MHNAKIIRIDENIFKGRTKERKLFDRKKSNNVTTINNPTILRIEDDVYAGEVKDGKPNGKGILKSKPKIKRSMWSRRAQEYEAKISSGKIYELAEVVRDLNKGDDLMVDQSYSERQLFEKAYERILTEFQIILNFSLEDTQKKLDKALKRNLETQSPKLTQKPKATPVSESIASYPQ